MSIQAPERPPIVLPEATPPPKRRVERLTDRKRRKRLRIGAVVLACLLALALVVAAANWIRGRGGHPPALSGGPPPSSLAWGVQHGRISYVAVVGVPSEGAPVVMAVPGPTTVDIPAGPRTVGQAASIGPGMLMAGVQAALDRAVGHYLISDADELSDLIDRLDGILVQTEAAFRWNGRSLGPGPEHLTGAAAMAYLSASPPADRTGRWEEVLTGLVHSDRGWTGPLGASDGPKAALQMLRAAQEAKVPILELPTAPGLDQTVAPDKRAIESLVRSRFGTAVRELVRVVVLNGNGRPGMATAIGAKLAPEGFRVVAAQNAVTFDIGETDILAGEDRFIEDARRVEGILGVGKVYVDARPSGIGDVTIVVGKDFQPG